MFDLLGRSPEFTPEDAARLRRVERKLDLILESLGLADSEEEAGFPERARAFADRGEKIAAIREYRQATGAGLSESKKAVEAYLQSRTGTSTP